ncbi:MAG TPA: MBL fold metallo-hydrolase [Longimicrobiales bacterium]|nr:MBL fold metallo-hydrolase [Longimicrobiales bacterium]
MELTFHGAAGTVTGSRFLVETGGARVLVDCGLFQGVKPLRLRNRSPFPVEPGSIDAVFLTHAHLDHGGWLPVLVREGFDGPIHCTGATADLCGILLPDSGRIQEEEADYANRKGFSRHDPALALYTEEDARRVLGRFERVSTGAWIEVAGVEARFRPAGHILGATGVHLRAEGTTLHFSGDLGREEDPLMEPPEPAEGADTIVMESTYGDREAAESDPRARLRDVLARTLERGGKLLVPSFAVGRAQTVLLLLHRIFAEEPDLRVPVYVNSPMATDVTDVYLDHPGGHRLSSREALDAFGAPTFVRSVQASKALVRSDEPMVVVAGSGMVTGGRIVHHLAADVGNPRHTVLLVGFQAPGTRGASLVAGAERIKMHGRWFPVRAEVRQLHGLSAHAQQGELVRWIAAAEPRPERVYLVHGEPAAADALRLLIQDELGLPARAAADGETVEVGT